MEQAFIHNPLTVLILSSEKEVFNCEPVCNDTLYKPYRKDAPEKLKKIGLDASKSAAG